MKWLRVLALVSVLIVCVAYLWHSLNEAEKDRQMLEKATDKMKELLRDSTPWDKLDR